MKFFKNMQNNVDIALEVHFFHMSMNGLVFPVDIVFLNESMNSLKYKENINFIERIEYAEEKLFSICVDVFKNYEGDDYNKIYEVLSTSKNKKLKINNILIEKLKNILEKPDFEKPFFWILDNGKCFRLFKK